MKQLLKELLEELSDPSLPCWILVQVVSGIFGFKGEFLLKNSIGIAKKAIEQKEKGKVVNHDLEKALERSFISALQSITLECHRELMAAKYPVRYYSYRRVIIVYPPAHYKNLQLLDDKLKRLAKHLKQLKQEESVKSLLASLDEIQSLLTPKGELVEQRIQDVEADLIKKALDYYEPPEPECWKKKVEEDLFKQVCGHFASEIKHEPVVRNILESQFLAQINANLTEQQLTIEELATGLRDLKQRTEQITTGNAENPPPRTQELHKSSEARVKITLEIPIDQLNTPQIADLIEKLRQL